MNLENVNLKDTYVQKEIKDAISSAFEEYLNNQNAFAEYDYGVNSGDVLKAEEEAFNNIINYIKEL